MEQRVIKFRAWDNFAKKFHYPRLWDNSMPSNWDKHYSLMQFTGLFDKNGKDVYEGDILKGRYTNPLSVVFENGAFCFENDQSSGNDRLHQMRTEKLEVIGNIYENPELLNNQL